MKNKKVCVTGVGGLIGSHLADYLLEQGYDVIGVDNLSGCMGRQNINKNISFIKGDLRSKNICDVVTKDVDIVYCIHAYASEGLSHWRREFIYDNNLISNIRLLNSSINNGVKRFVFTSSMAVYGRAPTPMHEILPRCPEDPYGNAKATFERELELANELFGLEYCILRPHNVYSERQYIADPSRNVLSIWINMLLKNESFFVYGDGEQRRAFSYCLDIIPALAKAGWLPLANKEVINLGSAVPVTLNFVADRLLEISGKQHLKPKYLPARPLEVKDAWCTVQKSKDLLGFEESITIDEGLKVMWSHFSSIGYTPPKYWGEPEIEKQYPLMWKEKLI